MYLNLKVIFLLIVFILEIKSSQEKSSEFSSNSNFIHFKSNDNNNTLIKTSNEIYASDIFSSLVTENRDIYKKDNEVMTTTNIVTTNENSTGNYSIVTSAAYGNRTIRNDTDETAANIVGATIGGVVFVFTVGTAVQGFYQILIKRKNKPNKFVDNHEMKTFEKIQDEIYDSNSNRDYSDVISL
jgi:predicted amino acid dehydrogenase